MSDSLVTLAGILVTGLVLTFAISERSKAMKQPKTKKQLENKYESYTPNQMCLKCDFSGNEKVCSQCPSKGR